MVASSAAAKTTTRSGAPIVKSRSKESSLLAARAEQEYTYVQRDIRRIAVVDGGLVVVMFVLFIVIDLLGIIKL